MHFGVRFPANNVPLSPEGNKEMNHLHTFTGLICADIVIFSVSLCVFKLLGVCTIFPGSEG